MLRGGKREGAGMKPTCLCGECNKCKHRIIAKNSYRKKYVPRGTELEENKFKRLENGEIIYDRA